jgi:hypothetical protein
MKDPSTKIQDPKKIQAPGSNRSGGSLARHVEAWILELLWLLVLGSWSFEPQPRTLPRV